MKKGIDRISYWTEKLSTFVFDLYWPSGGMKKDWKYRARALSPRVVYESSQTCSVGNHAGARTGHTV